MAYLNPVRHITFDARDSHALARFWSGLTGYALEDSEPDGEWALVSSGQPGVPGLLFLRVPDDKAVKNRLHLDIQPPSGTRDAEVERLLGLGARVVDDRRTEDGLGWVVMADVEGNEFCVERSAVERGLVPA
ncbi:glyoxalase/bleomycin resistance/dioxygenase family protein [Streptomyces antioxidans]|uniref:Glyoxalase/bleomycin resistance/dioxygenase family protein n=1 Tax=Streptomyces antioxidans TaxID=1507734 RepID=A0A1V4CVQ7_9ACTN|nr:VOC family protein [Streptomyces antioxidans]OPF71552.1 glyoxalase/bleomycin resistance/dioxygenase family protein [Streptomyces antioxidans]